MIRVVGYPRLHAGLFDLGTATPRQYGGVGMALEGPPTVVRVQRAPRQASHELYLIDMAARRDIEVALTRLDASWDIPPLTVTVDAIPPQHVGFGTKTTLVLAVLKAASEVAALGLDEIHLQRLSGRGGTSGIGIHTFFRGGLVIDGGHRSDPPRIYGPSSSSASIAVPPLIAHVSIPAHWCVTLLLAEGARRAGAAERAAFDEMTPVPDEEVRATIALAVMGMAASAATEDLPTFATALAAIQRTGFKAKEVSTQPDAVRTLLAALAELPACAAGMSSMGPLVFAISDREDASVRDQIVRLAEERRATVVGTVGLRNQGFDVE